MPLITTQTHSLYLNSVRDSSAEGAQMQTEGSEAGRAGRELWWIGKTDATGGSKKQNARSLFYHSKITLAGTQRMAVGKLFTLACF